MKRTLDRSEIPHASARTAVDRAHQVRRAAQEILQQEESRRAWSDSEVMHRYPALLPELMDELRVARQVRFARTAAKNLSQAAASAGPAITDAASAVAAISKSMGNLEIIERLDQGGQGVIYKAVETDTERIVAIKVLHDGPLSSPSQQERFSREAQLISQMNHPNIVRFYRNGAVGSLQFFVMEYVDGIPIDDYVEFYGLTVRKTVELFIKVCRAVASAHQLGIVHRDLKPGNILVDLDGEPHLLDFGLAKNADAAPIRSDWGRITTTGQVLGTLPYISPEQASGAPAQVDVRSDVYSLGVILFELLAGSLPYPVDLPADQVRANILQRAAPSLRASSAKRDPRARCAVGSVPDDLERVVHHALAKEKDRRYDTAEALADDLARFLTGHPVQARPDSWWYATRKAIGRHKVLASFSIAFVVLLVAGLVSFFALWRHSQHVARVAQAGLQMGSYIKLGQVARDQGRTDQAIKMMEHATQLGEAISTNDPMFKARKFTTSYQLADLYYDSGRAEQARPWTGLAARIAEELYQANPESDEYMRLVGFSQMLSAKDAMSSHQYSAAIRFLERASAIRRQLVKRNPANDHLLADLAYSLAIEGKCHRAMSSYQPALRRYRAAYELYLDLARRSPQNVDRMLDVALTENRLATWYLSFKTPDGNRQAGEWLRKAEQSLALASRLKGAENCSADLGRLRSAIERNSQLLTKRSFTGTVTDPLERIVRSR